MVFRAWLCQMQRSSEVSSHRALVYVHTWQMGLVWWGCGVPKLVLVRAETNGESPVMKLLMIRQFVFTFFEAGGGKLDYSILIPGYIPMDVVIHHLYAVAFYTHPAGRWWWMGGSLVQWYVQALCWECRFQVRFFFWLAYPGYTR